MSEGREIQILGTLTEADRQLIIWVLGYACHRSNQGPEFEARCLELALRMATQEERAEILRYEDQRKKAGGSMPPSVQN